MESQELHLLVHAPVGGARTSFLTLPLEARTPEYLSQHCCLLEWEAGVGAGPRGGM